VLEQERMDDCRAGMGRVMISQAALDGRAACAGSRASQRLLIKLPDSVPSGLREGFGCGRSVAMRKQLETRCRTRR